MPASPELTAPHTTILADSGHLLLNPILPIPSPLPVGTLPLGALPHGTPPPAGDSVDASDDPDADAPADSRMSLLEQLERRQDQVLLELDQLDQRVLKLIEDLGRYRSSQ